MLDEVKGIAARVRRHMEKRAAIEFMPDDLECMCGRASVALWRALVRAGIPATLVSGYFNDKDGWPSFHAWVEADGRIVDVTATQFGIPNRVYVIKSGTGHARARYTANLRNKDALSNITGWPISQQPKRVDRV